MVSSLAYWAPAAKVACPQMRKATAGLAQLRWSEALEEEYQNVRTLIKNNLKLSPYDPSRWLNLVIDGSATHGMGWILFQWADEGKPSSGATIIDASLSLLPPNIGFSPCTLIRHQVLLLLHLSLTETMTLFRLQGASRNVCKGHYKGIKSKTP